MGSLNEMNGITNTLTTVYLERIFEYNIEQQALNVLEELKYCSEPGITGSKVREHFCTL